MSGDLQSEVLLLALPPLSALGVVLAFLEHPLPGLLEALSPGVLFFLWPAAVWGLRRWRDKVGALALVVGYMAAVLYVAFLQGVPVAILMLALPAGLASLFLGMAAGQALSAALTLWLLLMPSAALHADRALRIATVANLWSSVGLMWLARRPLLTALEWSWSSYTRSRASLERARDYQAQLKQTLQDLAEANAQFARLNDLAQGLRRLAEESRQAKERFVANVSHELRTPLNMIIGFCEMVVESPEVYGNNVPGALLADLAVVLRNGEHLSSLVDDVLDLSQIEAGKLALVREPVPLGEIIDAAITAVRPLYESKKLYLEAEVAPALPPVFCDRTRIREVVLNLLSNAGRFTDQGGARVRVWQEDGDVVISVADSGLGIVPADAEKLFSPFQQLEGATKGRSRGSGLGLAISKALVELHGGRMWLHSEGGAGSTFFVRLPIGLPELDVQIGRWFNPHLAYEERRHRGSVPPPTLRPRFVVVEAGQTLARLIRRYYEGAELTSVAAFDEAKREVGRAPVQAILANSPHPAEAHQLFEGQGLPAGIPLIACSVEGVAEAADALGAEQYLVKPVSRRSLLKAIEQANPNARTVLVVDDEPEAIQLFQRMLGSAKRGYRVLRATDGEQALAILHGEDVDLVLLDLVMPGLSGYRLLDIRSQDEALRRIPVIVISACDPRSEPLATESLTVTQRGGLSVSQLLACVEALTSILTPARAPVGPAPQGRHAV